MTAEGWAEVREKARNLSRWTDRAAELAAAAPTRPGFLARCRGRRAARRAERFQVSTVSKTVSTVSKTRRSWVPYVAPVAALGTAAALQVAVFTDTVGGKLAAALARSDVAALSGRTWLGYVAGMLLGLAVAACAEGGAAHLMRLYDQHLVARDSTGLLRLGMLAYVAGSAALIHWWLDKHEFPTVVAWVLAGMTGSSLFLWSRSSRWKHRVAMRAAGQLDPALVRLPLAAKLLHPWRWLVTLYLVSWEPAATTGEARDRYTAWSRARRVDTKAADTKSVDTKAADTKPADTKAVDTKAADTKAVDTKRLTRKRRRPLTRSVRVNRRITDTKVVDTKPWQQSVPVDTVDPDTDLAQWTSTPRGMQHVATARVAVATRRAAVAYDEEHAADMIRGMLAGLSPDLKPREAGRARRQIDAAVMERFGVSDTTARNLRRAVSGEPVSAPPSDEEAS